MPQNRLRTRAIRARLVGRRTDRDRPEVRSWEVRMCGIRGSALVRRDTPMTTGAYEGLRRVVYGKGTDYDGATFVPVCETCGRFVKAGRVTFRGGTVSDDPNATCSKCGPTHMLFEGFI